jgi:peptide/nickel transport system substrate-binding protein
MIFARPTAVAAVLAIAAGMTACASTPSEDEESTLRIGVAAASISFDRGNLPANQYTAAVYDSLFFTPDGIGLPGDGGAEPWLAEEWSYSEGNTVLTIDLRDDVLFTDGTPLDAAAVKANIDDAVGLGFIPNIEEVTVTDENTLIVHQSRASALTFVAIGDRPIVNPAALADTEQLAIEPAGSGPYLLDDYVTDSSYAFVRNPDYWNPEAFPFDRIEMTLLPDLTARVNALKSGQIDVAVIDTATAAEVEAAGFSLATGSGLWAGLYFGDRRGEINPAIGNVKVRQALSLAMDRVGFNDASEGGYGDPSNQIGVPGQAGFFIPERADEYAYDLEAARELMAEAGYADGFDIDIPETAAFAKYIPYYKQTFEDLGVRVNWIQLPADDWITDYLSGKFALLPFADFTAGVVQQAEIDGVWNPWKNTDPETEELLEVYNSGSDEEALEALTSLNEKIIDEAWFAVLSHSPTVVAYADGFEVKLNGITKLPLQNITPAE